MVEITIKNRPYCLFNNMVNIKNFDPSLLEKSKLSCKSANINIFFILNIGTMKSLDYANINSENPLYLIFNNVD